MNRRARGVLWVDASAACAAGIFVLASRGFLAELERFSPALLTFVGCVNLLYASYSGSLAALSSRGWVPARWMITVLVVANLAWAAACVLLLSWTWRSASPFGSAHVAFEGCFVATLAVLEALWVRPHAR